MKYDYKEKKYFRCLPITICRIERSRHECPLGPEPIRAWAPSSILLHSRNISSLSGDLSENHISNYNHIGNLGASNY
jgi:hypothetical protein